MIADLTLTCNECGDEFLFSAEEQAFFQGQGFKNAPRRCRSCRRSRKAGAAANGAGARRPREARSFPATCSACGASTHVPFQPDPARPAFCRTCYGQRRAR